MGTETPELYYVLCICILKNRLREARGHKKHNMSKRTKMYYDFKTEQEIKLSNALVDFKKQYPNVNSSDIQTFIIGFNAALN